MRPLDTLDEAIIEASRLPYGLGNPETPFGGVKDSGYGFEGGSEAIEACLQTRFAPTADL
jgi:hypothetical protein